MYYAIQNGDICVMSSSSNNPNNFVLIPGDEDEDGNEYIDGGSIVNFESSTTLKVYYIEGDNAIEELGITNLNTASSTDKEALIDKILTTTIDTCTIP